MKAEVKAKCVWQEDGWRRKALGWSNQQTRGWEEVHGRRRQGKKKKESGGIDGMNKWNVEETPRNLKCSVTK